MFNLPNQGENESAKSAAKAFIAAKAERDTEKRNTLLFSGLIDLAKSIQELHAEVRRKAKKP